MRKFLAILFLIIFSTQVLPVKSIGKVLCSGQNNEEVQEHAPGSKLQFNFHDKYWYLHYLATKEVELVTTASTQYLLQDEALIKCFNLDVLLQPPNNS